MCRTALRLPSGAPVRSNPPWYRHRPLSCVDTNVHAFPDISRAPQMARPSDSSSASTTATQSAVHDLAQGLPRGVVRASAITHPPSPGDQVPLLIGGACCTAATNPQQKRQERGRAPSVPTRRSHSRGGGNLKIPQEPPPPKSPGAPTRICINHTISPQIFAVAFMLSSSQ